MLHTSVFIPLSCLRDMSELYIWMTRISGCDISNAVCYIQLEFDLRDTVDWAGSGLLISMLERLNWFCLTVLITLVLLMWKWLGLVLRKNHLLRCWGGFSLLNWIGALTLSLLLNQPPRKLEPWFVLWVSFSWGCSLSL